MKPGKPLTHERKDYVMHFVEIMTGCRKCEGTMMHAIVDELMAAKSRARIYIGMTDLQDMLMNRRKRNDYT